MNTKEKVQRLLFEKADALVTQSSSKMANLIDPSFVYINSYGKQSNKSEYIEQCCSSGKLKFKSQKIENLEVLDFGSFAVATMILQDEFEYLGEPYKGSFRSMCVFRKDGTNWRWAAGQTNEA
jgi:regulatory protein YycH of two-component signal transduction system YycFG